MASASRDDAVECNAMLEWLRQRESEMAGLIGDLVAVPTENPPGRFYGACVDLLEARLVEAGLNCQRLKPEGFAAGAADAPEILMASHGSGEQTIYFHGHYDVVPAQSAAQFQPLTKEHFVFGRGSADMKGGIVAMLYAIRVLKKFDVDLRGRIKLVLVPNEETGGADGTAWLVQQGMLQRGGVGMLLAEPTSGVAWNANRGAISLRVRVFGKSAHVGLQHQGEKAFERMCTVVLKLQELKREVEKRTAQESIGSEQGRSSILMIGGESGGGTNFNVVPAVCWFTVDRRINPEEDLEVEKNKILTALKSCQDEGIPLEWDIFQEGAAPPSMHLQPSKC
jgi:succinyl-diaminopimelate desuccinylase